MIERRRLGIIAPAAPSVRIAPGILMKSKLVLGVVFRLNCFIGAHKGTRPAAVAIPFDIGHLPDNIHDLPGKLWLRDNPFRPNLSLKDYRWLYGKHGAHRGTPAAPFATVVTPFYDIGKIANS
jgi:hypothetical protein